MIQATGEAILGSSRSVGGPLIFGEMLARGGRMFPLESAMLRFDGKGALGVSEHASLVASSCSPSCMAIRRDSCLAEGPRCDSGDPADCRICGTSFD